MACHSFPWGYPDESDEIPQIANEKMQISTKPVRVGARVSPFGVSHPGKGCQEFDPLSQGTRGNLTRMRNLHVLSATRRWHRSYRSINFLRLFSVSSCHKITHCDTYYGWIWKDFVHQCKVLDISSVLSMQINIFFCQNTLENCTHIFLPFDVNRDKSRLLRHHACRFLIILYRVVSQPYTVSHLTTNSDVTSSFSAH
jgi:hypothetical protein